jgi:RHS repeat-associated protein
MKLPGFLQVSSNAIIKLSFHLPKKCNAERRSTKSAIPYVTNWLALNRIGLLVAVCISVVGVAQSQIGTPAVPDNGPTTTSPLGVPPGSSAAGTSESVSLMNGYVNLFIPVLSLPQRGGYSLDLGYVSNGGRNRIVQTMTISSTSNSGQEIEDTISYYNNRVGFGGEWTDGWSGAPVDVNLPKLGSGSEFMGDYAYVHSGVIDTVVNMFCETNFTFTDWAGNTHPFENVTNCNSVHVSTDLNAVKITDSTDGSFYRLDTTDPTDFKVTAKGGTIYHFHRLSGVCTTATFNGGDCPGSNLEGFARTADQIVDTNGNTISIARTSGSATIPTYVITDTIGRSITIDVLGIHYKDSNGNAQTVSIASSLSSDTTTYADDISCTYGGPPLYHQGTNTNPTLIPLSGVQSETEPTTRYFSITFPQANGSGARTYSLQFDARNRLSKVQYPYGGYSRYDYSEYLDKDKTAVKYFALKLQNNVQCSYTMEQVLHKYECRDSSGSCSTEDTTSYDATINNNDTNTGTGAFNSSITVTRPLGDYETHTFSTVYPARTNPQETDIQYFDASGNTLRTQHNDFPSYSSLPGATWTYDAVFPSMVTTKLYAGSSYQTSSVTYQYDTFAALPSYYGNVYIDNPTSITEQDYDGITKLTITEYWAHAGYFSSNAHILDRPTSKTVTDNVKNLTATTTYAYDNGSNTVGNLTSSSVSASNAANQVTSYSRNPFGQVTQVTDPNSNITQIQYTDTNGWGNSTCAPSSDSSAYPTKVIDALGENTQYKYNSCTGTIASVTGPNPNQTTTYSYDALQRVVSASFPDTGAKEACYFDAAPSSVTTYTLQAAGSSLPSCSTPTAVAAGSISNSLFLDGFGRKTQSELLSDPSGAIFSETTYDANGRVASVSNPYRSTTESSYGNVQYQYDGLDRKTGQTNQDGSTQSWSYAENVTTSTDELGNQWQRTSDAFGRLTKVLEPNGGSTIPSMATSYTYDGFGNLWNVAQTGGSSNNVSRSFTYDGLSRLLTSSNPETGTIGYTYDNNGNLLQKTEPSPNVAAGTSTTTLGYCYDALNRLVAKFASPPPPGCNTTPTYIQGISGALSTYTYLSSASSSYPNAIGQLIDEKAYLNRDVISERSFLGYDLMGRVISETQSGYNLTNSYDLAGHQTSRGNNATNITLGYGYDSAGRLSGITSNLISYGASTYPSTLYSVSGYSPVGISQATYGGDPNNTGFFNLFRYYDNRERVVDNEVYSNNDGFGTASVTIAGSVIPGDTGKVTVTAGLTKSYSFGANDTVSSIASQIAYEFNQDGQSVVTATVGNTSSGTSGSGVCVAGVVPGSTKPCAVITLKAIQLGIYGNVALAATEADANTTSPSFVATASGLALSGGTGSPQGPVSAYVYTLSYDQANNVRRSADPYNGSWFYSYDTLNRLKNSSYYNYEGSGVVVSTGPNPGTYVYQCWAYDGFGNRTNELYTNSPCPVTLTNANSSNWATFNTSNQISGSTTGGVVYDGAGNVIQDSLNSYAYDEEGRLCAVQNNLTLAAYQYLYDAEGRRFEKGTISGFPRGTVCASPHSPISLPPGVGFSATEVYLLGPTGEQEVELDFGSGNITQAHQNVYADGGLLATYTVTSGADPALYFDFNDWQGTKRLQVNAAGQAVNWWSSDPFGDYLNPHIQGGPDATEHHFTGKERDTESGNDYFGARYYGSSMGRFMSPDWSAKAEPVPYAKLDDPQSLNLYAYVLNNPLRHIDSDGHQIYGRSYGSCEANAAGNGCSSGDEDKYQMFSQPKQAQQQYGRQADGSYKADPAKVQAAIKAKKPIGGGQCVDACSALSGVTNHTPAWTPGKSISELNDTTDIGLAVASFGDNNKFTQPGGDQNSAIYMGHDPKTGQIMVVDQWPPPNKPQYNAPFEHPLDNHGAGHNPLTNRMENNAYYYHVIVVR